jgi:hypothetical protein
MRQRAALLLVVCSLVLVPAVVAEETAAPAAAGFWTGTVEMPFGPLDVVVTLAEEEGGWIGRIDIPAQGIHGLALEEVAVAGQEVRFKMSGVAGDPRFAGHLAADGGSMAGTFNHATRDFPFSLTRSDTPPADLEQLFAGYIEPGVPGEGVVGQWRGLLEAGVSKLRVELQISTAEDGTLIGNLSSPDQGSMAVRLDSIVVEDEKVTIDVAEVGAVFDGYLVDDGATLLGQWTQNRVNFPISFRRQAEPGAGGK